MVTTSEQLSLLNLPPVSPIQQAVKRRDEGMQRALDHAERVKKEWANKAIQELKVIIAKQTEPFLAEDLITGLTCPPDKRAWGPIFRRLAMMGIIRSVGTGRANSSNRSFKVKWERAE